MDNEFQDIEDSLKGMRPAAPDSAYLDRLLAAVEGRLQKSDLSLGGIESRLAAMQPVAIAPVDFERMLETVSQVPFPVDEKVVLFPGKAKPAAASKAASRRPWYAAAAAVAVAGAFSAMMIDGQPGAKGHDPVAQSRTERTLPFTGPLPPSRSGNVVRASSGLQEASDQGVSWQKDGRPMRVVRVRYLDKVQFTDTDGKLVEMEVPREELMLVPEKID
ncbi:hypothetical protein [Luteolibacter sp. Populi]|uniref:hypothetical protein n=1 Tax=Luteolibacter sp. Populi TaxID=3230487 RepID=UPI0034652CC1